MKLDFEPGEIVEAFTPEPRQRIAKNLPRRERHRFAVGEINVAEKPAGIGRPWQHLKRRRVGHHDEIAATLHLRHGEAAAGGEHRIDRLMRGILGEQRRRHGDAAAHQRRGVGGDDGLAAQHAMLIGERKPHQLQLVFPDRLLDRLGFPRLIFGPKTVALDEADRYSAARRHGSFLPPPARGRSARRATGGGHCRPAHDPPRHAPHGDPPLSGAGQE